MLLWLGLIIAAMFASRVVYVMMKTGRNRVSRSTTDVKLMAVAGSGGHTTELIRLLQSLPSGFAPRHYVVATSDKMSENKIMKFEKSNSQSKEDFFIYKIPRSREVAQSWSSTVYTTIVASLYSFPLMWKSKPDLILCNGPGTCIPICFVGLLFKFLGICWTDIIYVESICRVTTMSMSGWILYPLSDMFFVQWPQLLKGYPKAIYLGGRIA